MLCAVYPCVYREHVPSSFSRIEVAGLSLCIQGTYTSTQAIMKITRFIPVYTGNIALGTYIFIATTVYPCVYREHIAVSSIANSLRGLSLCIQGTSANLGTVEELKRFIPVYTGNMAGISHSTLSSTVYPCVYREHTNYNILFYN